MTRRRFARRRLGLSVVCGLAITTTLASAQTRPRGSFGVGVGGGYAFPLTSLGTFQWAEGTIGRSPVIALTLSGRLGGRWAAGVGGVAGLDRSIEIKPSPSCQGPCEPFTIDGQGRFIAAGIEVSYDALSGRQLLSFGAGPWIRAYNSPPSINVCDLDVYCRSAVHFLTSDTRVGLRMSIRWMPLQNRLPIAIEAADLIAGYRTGKTQHHATLMALAYLFR